MVLKLQAKLHDLGYYQGALDGSFGTGTSNAVASFQSANQLSADGIAGMETLRALHLISTDVSRSSASTNVTSTPNSDQPPYKEGMSGDNVLELQSRLRDLGYYQALLMVHMALAHEVPSPYSSPITTWKLTASPLGNPGGAAITKTQRNCFRQGRCGPQSSGPGCLRQAVCRRTIRLGGQIAIRF